MPARSRYYRKTKAKAAAEDAGFGWDPDADGEVPAMPALPGETPSDPDPALVALGEPPDDAAGIQKWNYRLLSTMAYLAVKDNTISNETRLKRAAALTAAAARHYPEAAKYDLAQQIARDAAEVQGRKRAKAAAKLERRSVAGGAKVIPIRRDAQGS